MCLRVVPQNRRAIGLAEAPLASVFTVPFIMTDEEVERTQIVERAYCKRGMLTRMVGLHKPQSLFRLRLDVGELMYLSSFKKPERFYPPGGVRSQRIGPWAMVLFFAVFPLSRNGFRSLHGWSQDLAWPLFLAVLPVRAVLLLVQVLAAVLGAVSVLCFGTFGCIYAMCAFGDTKITLRWLQDFPHLVINTVYTYYYAGSPEQWINMSGSAMMMIKGLAGDMLFSLKAFLEQKPQIVFEDTQADIGQTITQLLAPLAQPGMEGRQPGSLPREMVGVPSDGDPCLCAGTPLDPFTGKECAACACERCCTTQRRTYTDAVSYLFGVLSFGEALWACTGAQHDSPPYETRRPEPCNPG